MPLLKYQRMRAHLATILQPEQTRVTALAISPKFLVVGTSTGEEGREGRRRGTTLP